ncbi:MAG: acyl-CoA dehydratase activase, partial [Bryobacteraceae bacterium]
MIRSSLIMDTVSCCLGLDLGSVSLKATLVRRHDILFERWVRVAGDPIGELCSVLEELSALYPEVRVSGIGVTGSGRGLIAGVIDSCEVNEISAHARAAALIEPRVNSIIEIGGQDSKLIIFEEGDQREAGNIRHFAMNEMCAAGTGAFLDQQAARLNLSIEEFANLALDSTSPVRIAGRCAVFAKTDMTHHQQEGRSLADIVAGLNEALVRSYLSNLVRGRELPKPIAFQGGVARNVGLAATFGRLLELNDGELVVPGHHLVMGAIGAALMAGEKDGHATSKLADVVAMLKRKAGSGEVRQERGCLAELRKGSQCHSKVKPDFSSLKLDGAYLGIDVGSVSIKVAVLSSDGVALSDYRFSEGRPLKVLNAMLGDMRGRLGEPEFDGVGVTGSGRHFVSALLGADVAENEITAQSRAAACLLPGVDTVIEIGGQDAKFIRLDGLRPTSFAMNRVCAAGTGAFLQEQAARLGVGIEEEFSAEAFGSRSPVALGARCTVFMESDLVSHQQQGAAKRDLIAGLAYSVVENYLDKVVAGRKIGDKILFLGGVAENEAVAAAISSVLQREVATSGLGKVSGAIGAALAAFDARREGRFQTSTFTANALLEGVEQFTCEHCSNACRITRMSREGLKHFGGRCGRWGGRSRKAQPGASPLRRRFGLLEEASAAHRGEVRAGAQRIGIPRALMAYDRLALWRCFFEAMGFEVVVSPETDEEILSEGVRRQVVETCLPVKAFCAHLRWLEANGRCDSVLVPSLVTTGIDRHGKETHHCPFVQSMVQFAKPVTPLPLLNPVINSRLHPDDEELAMLEVAQRLGVDRQNAEQAWLKAVSAHEGFRESIRKIGQKALGDIASGKLKRAFVLLGKDYNTGDPRLNSEAGAILEARGECVITQDMIADDSGAYSPAYRTMYWSHSKEILAAAELAARTPGLFAVMITSFGCGPDSFTMRFVSDIMGEKPMLLLEVDEHSSPVGMETRIEAFLDGLPKAPQVTAKPARPAVARPRGIRRVYVPNFSDHGLAFAAAVHDLGLEPVLTSAPDDGVAKAGVKHCTSGECHPFSLMLGGYIQAAEPERGSTDACYLIPESPLCRLGQFGTQMRLVAEEMGLTLPVYTRFEDLARVGKAGLARAGITYWQAMRGMDLLLQKFFETRAREVTQGATDAAYRAARKELTEAMFQGRVREALDVALRALDAVDVDRDRKLVKIGITGDYFTRICDYANADMFRHIERMGGVVMLPPTMSDLVKFDANQKLRAARSQRKIGSSVLSFLSRYAIEQAEKRIRAQFDGSLSYDVPLDYKRGADLIAPYMDAKMPSGFAGSVAAILEQIHAGADGILNLITLHCSYGLVLSSVLASIDKDF